MHFSKGTKYITANVLLVVIALVAFRYMSTANAPHSQSAQASLLLGGTILYTVASTVVIIRAYYRNQRFQFLDKTPLHTATTAEALLGAERLKPSTVKLTLSDTEYATLTSNGAVVVKPDKFTSPIRRGDQVDVSAGDAMHSKAATAIIADIDGYNQAVSLRLKQ